MRLLAFASSASALTAGTTGYRGWQDSTHRPYWSVFRLFMHSAYRILPGVCGYLPGYRDFGARKSNRFPEALVAAGDSPMIGSISILHRSLCSALLLLTALTSPSVAHNGAGAIAVPVEGIVVDGQFDDWPRGGPALARRSYGGRGSPGRPCPCRFAQLLLQAPTGHLAPDPGGCDGFQYLPFA